MRSCPRATVPQATLASTMAQSPGVGGGRRRQNSYILPLKSDVSRFKSLVQPAGWLCTDDLTLLGLSFLSIKWGDYFQGMAGREDELGPRV